MNSPVRQFASGRHSYLASIQMVIECLFPGANASNGSGTTIVNSPITLASGMVANCVPSRLTFRSPSNPWA